MISLRNVITFPSVLTEINFYFNETTGQNAIMNKNHLVQHLEGMEHPPTLVNKKVTTFKKNICSGNLTAILLLDLISCRHFFLIKKNPREIYWRFSQSFLRY